VELALLQLSEWDQTKTYNDDPPTCLRVTIGWKVTLNGKPFAQDTEQDVVLTLACFLGTDHTAQGGGICDDNAQAEKEHDITEHKGHGLCDTAFRA
jgi:hypothetical protein